MPPAQQTVQVAKLFVEIVIALRPDRHRVDGDSGRGPDDLARGPSAGVRPDLLAILNPGFEEFSRDRSIDVDAGNDQRPEEIALPAFIDSEMRFEHFRRMHLLVAELRLLKNLGLELELNELLDPLALQQDLWPFLINRDAQFVFLREEERIGLRGEVEG